MLEEFRTLWNFLAKPAIAEQALSKALVSGDTGSVPAKLSTTIPQYPGIRDRDLLQADLRIVSELVFEGVSKDRKLEANFLKECYCPTGALSQYALASKQILRTRYAGLFDTNQPRPTLDSATTKKGVNPDFVDLQGGLSRRPVLLIGDVGVGKTTFIRNLMILDDEDLFKESMSFYIDLGAGATLTGVSQFVLQEIVRQLQSRARIRSKIGSSGASTILNSNGSPKVSTRVSQSQTLLDMPEKNSRS
ncbi:MAG: hypothetical protein O3A53_10305 [Acidobacteria bacterium]|nr:hypothetical protein [Acidobacteriota bacterium]